MMAAGVLLLGACQQPQQARAPEPPRNLERNFTLLFDSGSAVLSVEAKAAAGRAAGTLKALGCCSVAVTGHTDTVGSAASNLELSRRRASAVANELLANGVPNQSMVVLGYGENDLPVPTAQNVADQRNRSVNIVVSDRRPEALLSDTDYCKRLSATYRRYRPNQIDEAAAQAMSRCESPDAVSAIPVLERALTEMKIQLPARMTNS